MFHRPAFLFFGILLPQTTTTRIAFGIHCTSPKHYNAHNPCAACAACVCWYYRGGGVKNSVCFCRCLQNGPWLWMKRYFKQGHFRTSTSLPPNWWSHFILMYLRSSSSRTRPVHNGPAIVSGPPSSNHAGFSVLDSTTSPTRAQRTKRHVRENSEARWSWSAPTGWVSCTSFNSVV